MKDDPDGLAAFHGSVLSVCRPCPAKVSVENLPHEFLKFLQCGARISRCVETMTNAGGYCSRKEKMCERQFRRRKNTWKRSIPRLEESVQWNWVGNQVEGQAKGEGNKSAEQAALLEDVTAGGIRKATNRFKAYRGKNFVLMCERTKAGNASRAIED